MRRFVTLSLLCPIFGLASSAYAQNAPLTDHDESTAGQQPTGEVVKTRGPINYASGLDATLWDNGPVITQPNCGLPGERSEVQVGNNNAGNNISNSFLFQVVDDFTTNGEEWNIERITMMAYQTSGTTAPLPANLYVYSGDPSLGAGQVPGSPFAFDSGNLTQPTVFRTFNAACDQARQLRLMVKDFNPPLVVNTGAGAYWVGLDATLTSGSGPWVPHVTITGQLGKPGANAMQLTTSGTVWQGVFGQTVPAPGINPQDVPFLIEGTKAGGACKWDLDGDGKVCQGDLGQLLASYGTLYGQPELGELLAEYNSCGGPCP